MCGIAGFAGSTLPQHQRMPVLKAMTDTLVHRGPDGGGYHLEPDGSVGFGHRRLAIVDLSDEGKQPMTSASSRFVITFNGEIYNYKALSAELASRGHRFRGHSDTEVMLAAFDEWGVAASLARFNGMFAFAVWDRHERRLWLARDRLGKKPLYYTCNGGALLFGSELKSLIHHPHFSSEIDRDAVCLFLRHNYIPAPYSVFKNVRKLEAGCYLTVDAQHAFQQLSVEKYWCAEQAFRQGQQSRFIGTYSDAVDALDSLLRDSIGLRMVADVPLGAFLSGGIDSSTVVALMQAQSDRPVRTFTIGFDEQGYSEAHHAEAVAKHLGTEHTDLYLQPNAALELIPKLPQVFDEPFADSSQLPTMLVSKLARQHVTVALSGDAGDELFCGYNRYVWWRNMWRSTHRAPRWLRGLTVAMAEGLAPETWDHLMKPILRWAPKALRHENPGDRIHKLASILREDDPARLYLRFVSHWFNPNEVVLGGHEPATLANSKTNIRNLDEYTEQMMLLDARTYLTDDIMVKVDRSSMAYSLEARAPLMDYRIYEFAASLPLSFKLEGTRGKRILRDVLYRYVPRELVDRPKTGFGVPIDSWLRGPLRDWAESLLSTTSLMRSGMFAPGPIRKAWAEHLTGTQQRQYLLWDVLMFEAWLQEWKTNVTDTPIRMAG